MLAVDFAHDCLNDAREIVHYVIIPKSDNPIALPGELDTPSIVGLLLQSVLSAIQFDGELPGGTSKIDDAASNRMLPTKPIFRWQLAKRPPQALLRLGCIAPQPSSYMGPLAEYHPGASMHIPLRPRGRRG